MKHIRTEIDIAAPAAIVWQVLTDFMAYPAWNPFVRSISGETIVGSRLNITVQPNGGQSMSFKPKLLVFNPTSELRWKGQLLAPGIFDGEHYFQLVESSLGKVRFTHGESFSGLLVPLVMRGTMQSRTELGFVAMNNALKARAEALR